MKILLVIIIFSIFLVFSNRDAEKEKHNSKAAVLKTDSIDFKMQVQPVLQKNCSPCHFPGGKLYEKMPFDNGITIINHESGILKRIKKNDEAKLIRQFISQTKVLK